MPENGIVAFLSWRGFTSGKASPITRSSLQSETPSGAGHCGKRLKEKSNLLNQVLRNSDRFSSEDAEKKIEKSG